MILGETDNQHDPLNLLGNTNDSLFAYERLQHHDQNRYSDR